MKELFNKTASTLTVGESLKLSAIITIALMPLAFLPLAFEKISEWRSNRK